MHDLSLITTISMGFTSAWLLGLLTQRCGLSPIVGYLLAGVLIGPYTPGFVGDIHLAQQLAEIGVILLMFGVGLHFQLADLLAVKGIAVPGAVGQSLVATLVSMAVFAAFGFSMTAGAVIGMAIAVASTVVLMRVLMDADVLNSPAGHVAVGWLLVEDMFTVVVLVLLPVLGTGSDGAAAALGPSLGLALAKLAALVILLWLVGSRVIPWVLVQVARLRSRELFTLTVLVFSIAMASASYVFFGASMALGAFLAGMVVALSPASHQAAADALPMRDAFAVLFFVSVGMLFDPMFIIREPLMLLAAMGIILVIKPLTALAIVLVLGYSMRTALTVALGLAQIGEFSFILSEVARQHELIPDSGHHLLVGAAILSITLNPLLFRMLTPLENWLHSKPRWWELLNRRAQRKAAGGRKTQMVHDTEGDPEADLAIVIGYGPVGRSVHQLLSEAGLRAVVIDLNMDTVASLVKQGHRAIFGDASQEAILEEAGMREASHLVVALPHAAARMAVITAARHLNSTARVLVRAHYLREREDLEHAGATAAVFEESEVAIALARLVLNTTGTHRGVVEKRLRDLRLQLIRENMSQLRRLRVQSVMVPWNRVRRLPRSASRQEVLHHISQRRFSRWPVVDLATGRVAGYLLTKDLIGQDSADGDWTSLIRPLPEVRPDADIESTLTHMQAEGLTICAVQENGTPLGIITWEDVLEQVFGRIEDETAPAEPMPRLQDAVTAGGVVLELRSHTLDEAIAELARSIPRDQLPPDVDVAHLAIAREREFSTDLGIGIAVPHARCPQLLSPVVVFGRSLHGIDTPSELQQPVRLIFLVVTPLDQPDAQLALLGQIAQLGQQEERVHRLNLATSRKQILEVLAAV
ncbi:MAG: cation:proton antiporter [Pirellulaceae bacterium]